MNRLTITDPKIFNGKPTSFYIPTTNQQIMKDQIWEVFVEEHYKKGKVKKNMTILDVGANIGSTALYFKDNAKVLYALEPARKNYECLVENTKPYKNIKTFNVGLAARTSSDILRSNGDYQVPESMFGSGPVTETVTLYSIEDFMTEQGIKHIDLMKIDTEGSEYIILPSHAFSRVARKIDYIIGESHYVGQQIVPEYIPLILKDYGFKTKFLPFENMFLTMSFNDVVKRDYKVTKQTIFFAWREK